MTKLSNKLFYSLSVASVLCWASCSKDMVNSITKTTTSTSDTLTPNVPITTVTSSDTSDDGNLLLGNPTNAISSTTTPDNYLINQTYYIESYSKSKAIPNWVSWHLQASDYANSVSRSEDFYQYTSFPFGWYSVTPYSYQYVTYGFDRGHNCPSGDRAGTTAKNNSTFYMINMIPQAPKLNQGPWEGMESSIRNLVSTGKEAFIIMGNYGIGGTGNTSGLVNYIIDGTDSIAVPAQVWKVAVIIPQGTNDLKRIDTSAIVMAVDMPNNNSLYTVSTAGKTAWLNYTTTINAIETNSAKYGKTINLLSAVSDSIKSYLKAKKYP